MRGKQSGVRPRRHASLAVSATGRTWTLVNATPDVHFQIESFPPLHPGPGPRETPLRNILLTDAELDHTVGLLLLREGSALDVYATAAVLEALTEALPAQRLLEGYAPVRWNEITPGVPFLLEEGGIRVKAFRTGGKRPRFVLGSDTESDWVIGYRLEDVRTGGCALYAPCIESWSADLDREVSSADCAFVDGTFWEDGDMMRARVGPLTARQMGHLPISGPGGSAGLFGALDRSRIVYVHINNTNPVLDERSPERHSVTQMGFEIGWDGMDVEV